MANVTHEKRKAAGLCVGCGLVPPREGVLRCPGCSRKAHAATTASAIKSRAKRRKQGLCSCGAEPLPERKLCDKCRTEGRKKQAEFSARNRERGLCRCGKPKVEGGISCLKCRAESLVKIAKRKARGVCYRCTLPAMTGKVGCEKHMREACAKGKIKNAAIRKRVFDHYGWACKCCGETIQEFLTLDHINGGGTAHRKSLKGGKSGTSFYRWVVENGYPTDLETACMNCNWGRRWYNGICPHERQRREAQEQKALSER